MNMDMALLKRLVDAQQCLMFSIVQKAREYGFPPDMLIEMSDFKKLQMSIL